MNAQTAAGLAAVWKAPRYPQRVVVIHSLGPTLSTSKRIIFVKPARGSFAGQEIFAHFDQLFAYGFILGQVLDYFFNAMHHGGVITVA